MHTDTATLAARITHIRAQRDDGHITTDEATQLVTLEAAYCVLHSQTECELAATP